MDIVTISDAIAVLSYLHKRQILCDRCGDKLAVYENQWHHRCAGCISKNARYTAYKVPNELERRICSALTRWNEQNPADAVREPTGVSADTEGNG